MNRHPGDGLLYYRISNDGLGDSVVMVGDMFHLFHITDDGLTGISVVAKAKQALGLTIGAEEYGAQFFGNGAEPGGILERPKDAGKLKDADIKRLRETWQAMHSGNNRHKLGVLEDGMTWKAVGLPNEDIQFLETRQFQVLEIARWLDLPPHKVKHMGDATFSNIEHMQIEWYVDGLMPRLADWTQELEFKLLTPAEQGKTAIEFDARALMRGDNTTRANYYSTMVNNGMMTRNEVRRLENMTPFGPEADTLTVQLAMTDIANVGREQDETADMSAALRPVVVESIARLVRKECKAHGRAVAKCRGDATAFNSWMDGFLPGHCADAETLLVPIVQSVARSKGGDDSVRPCRLRATEIAGRWISLSRDRMNVSAAEYSAWAETELVAAVADDVMEL